jgi:chromosome segregation protein
MRLSKIKLAGFKSFVDPTTIPFPSNLVGVVGPNGCGKSNVIDAVRWVMGESSASRLRGDSITDVIFNGSSARKPVGAASVELHFDNTDSTLEGQYAKYSEIAIRREVSRDGISTYYLNGARCRRKDITGVFLGTGLGPRSYSIIEQGMISRLIEAKPEEMRVFIEEAAGISKYKERRRETSNRIKHTKENIERLMDVLDEVEKQIKHLDRQAKQAERYGRMKAEERHIAAELLALRMQALDSSIAAANTLLGEKQTALEAVIAEQRNLEAKLERTRNDQTERQDAFNEVQARYYKAGSEIARLEQAIDHAHEIRERQKQDLEQAVQSAKEIADHIDKDRSEIAQLELTLSELVPGLEQARQQESSSQASLERAEHALSEWQDRWNAYSHQLNDVEQRRNVESTRVEQLESRLASITERRRKLAESDDGADPEALASTVEELAAREQRKRESRDEYDRALEDVSDKIRKLRDQDGKLSRLVEERLTGLREVESRFASVEAVQKAALGEGNENIQSWLESAGMGSAARLAQKLEVEDGWERAVETVLGNYLQAVCVGDVTEAVGSLADLPSGDVTFLQYRSGDEFVDANPATLAAKVSNAPAAVLDLLSSVRIAESIESALAIREQIGGVGSVITNDGVWLSEAWLRVKRDKDASTSVLAREHELRRLRDQLRELRARSESAKKLQKDGRNRLNQLEDRREGLQREAAKLLGEYSEIKAGLDSARYQQQQAEARRRAVAEEGRDIEQEEQAAREQLSASRTGLQDAERRIAELAEQREILEDQRTELRAELQRVREQAGEDRRAAQDMAIQFESRRSSKESAAQNLDRMRSQYAHYGRRQEEIRQQLDSGEQPLRDRKEALELQLAVRVEIESELSESRKAVEEVEARLREFDQTRMRIDQASEEARSAVSEANMELRELRVRREGIAEQFAKTDLDLGATLEGLDEAATIESWEERLEKIRARIDRLGPINLAAIDEFKEQSERKEYLDSQLADLNDALSTLEGAIRKIDRETRSRFRETYENVDSGFKRLFPKLFGGGHAYLELTGDDLLSAGITVMARPPGKRNSTIHLLSGGEKALTAVALVFAIFELNPAPFCMLDEVDAPLDDANVLRFCDIVREMSDRVQFVFITHNKVTMELSRQLTGVTMQEPGVSRLVSVDIDEAVRLAAS